MNRPVSRMNSWRLDRTSACVPRALPLSPGSLACVLLVWLFAHPWPICGAMEAGSLPELENRLAIRIVTAGEPFPVKNSYGPIDGRDAPPEALAAYLPLLASEFNLYPASFVRRSGVKRIVLCTELKFSGQRWNAVPDYDHDTLYLEVVRGNHDPIYQRRVIHHDFFHFVDWQDDGEVDRDPAWSALNPQGFRYGLGGAAAQNDPRGQLLDPTLVGFVDRYAQSAVEEDKAELFAALVVCGESTVRRAERDEILASKIRMLRANCLAFCPEIDERFWKQTRLLRRGGDADGQSRSKGN